MSETISLTVDDRRVEVSAGASILDACDRAGVYVPRLCAYPGLDPLGDCGLCFVKVDGGAARRACSVVAAEGMVIDTLDVEALGFRASSMKAILGDHPHVCLTCPQRYGCNRDECMYGNPPEMRCCGEFGRCEIAKVAAFVGAFETAPFYAHRRLGETVDHNIRRDLDLCIGCGRCVAACDTLEEAGSALMLVETGTLLGAGLPKPQSYLGRHLAVPKADDLRASGCTFCGACVIVCPTGAVTAVGRNGVTWLAKRRERSTLHEPVLPPEDRLTLKAEIINEEVPANEGVFRLFDVEGNVLQITGAMDLRAALLATLVGSSAEGACTFRFEEDPMYTQRESGMLAQYVQEHGRMPRGNDVLGDLFSDDNDDER